MNTEVYRVIDLRTEAVIADSLTHPDAYAVCQQLEPVPTREDGWRYVIEPQEV